MERAHRIAADNCMRLDNLVSLKALLDALDWQKCFEECSAVEIELSEDPARVYAAMDAQSRARVRAQVEMLADDLRVEEGAVARQALLLARSVSDADDPRSTVCWYLMEDAGRAELYRALNADRRPRKMLPDASGRGSVAQMCIRDSPAEAPSDWNSGVRARRWGCARDRPPSPRRRRTAPPAPAPPESRRAASGPGAARAPPRARAHAAAVRPPKRPPPSPTPSDFGGRPRASTACAARRPACTGPSRATRRCV